jgi:hypothetical protein
MNSIDSGGASPDTVAADMTAMAAETGVKGCLRRQAGQLGVGHPLRHQQGHHGQPGDEIGS